MKTVRIEKTKLVEILTANATTHRQEWDVAIAAWQKAQGAKLEAAYRDLESAPGSFKFLEYHLSRPEDHSDDYARALKKLSLSADDVIELDAGEYQTYVEDEWSWQRAHKHLVGTYAG